MSTSKPDYTKFCCPNPACCLYNQFNQRNIFHRSWTGVKKDIERLRCSACKKEFSSRTGTLQERAKVSEEKQELMLKCFRWGVCDEGVADICAVNLKTVRLFQDKAAKRAEVHHDNLVKEINAPAVQVDELYGKTAGGKHWIGQRLL